MKAISVTKHAESAFSSVWRTLGHLRTAGWVALSAITAPLAHADGLSWNYFDADYLYSEVSIDDEEVEVDGLNVEGSLMFTDKWMLQAGYASSDASLENVASSGDTFEAGAAYRFGISDALNVQVGGGYAYAEADATAVVGNQVLRFDAKSHGGYLKGSVRGRFARRFEVEGLVTGLYYTDSAFDEDIIFGVKGRFYITPLIAVAFGAFGSKEADDPVFTVGLRLEGTGFK